MAIKAGDHRRLLERIEHKLDSYLAYQHREKSRAGTKNRMLMRPLGSQQERDWSKLTLIYREEIEILRGTVMEIKD